MTNQQNRRKNFGWVFWIVALFFVHVACSIELNDEEKKAITGLYIQVTRVLVNEVGIVIHDENDFISMGKLGTIFKFEKHTDEEKLYKFSSESLKAMYYLKGKNENELVVMSDGSLQGYQKGKMGRVLYKIEEKLKERMITFDQMLVGKSDAVYDEIEKLQNILESEQLENLANEVDAFLGEDYTRVSILNAESTSSKDDSIISTSKTSSKHNARISIPKLSSATKDRKPELPIITCSVVLIIVVIFLCVQCCQSRHEPNVENLPIEQLKTNDLSNQYHSSSTDLVIDVKETESMQSIPAKINPSTSITTISSLTMKINRSNLFTVESIGSEEINESKSTQTMEPNSNQSVSTVDVKTTDIERNNSPLASSESSDLVVTKPKATHSESKENPKNTNDTDDFTI